LNLITLGNMGAWTMKHLLINSRKLPN